MATSPLPSQVSPKQRAITSGHIIHMVPGSQKQGGIENGKCRQCLPRWKARKGTKSPMPSRGSHEGGPNWNQTWLQKPHHWVSPKQGGIKTGCATRAMSWTSKGRRNRKRQCNPSCLRGPERGKESKVPTLPQPSRGLIVPKVPPCTGSHWFALFSNVGDTGQQ